MTIISLKSATGLPRQDTSKQPKKLQIFGISEIKIEKNRDFRKNPTDPDPSIFTDPLQPKLGVCFGFAKKY